MSNCVCYNSEDRCYYTNRVTLHISEVDCNTMYKWIAKNRIKHCDFAIWFDYHITSHYNDGYLQGVHEP